MIERQGIIIFYSSNKALSEIKKLDINVVYDNNKENYLVGYIDKNQNKFITKTLLSSKFIKKVEHSLLDMANFQE